jgi:hypothetical protein
MESLRLAFGRIAEDNILCILTILQGNILNIKHMADDK